MRTARRLSGLSASPTMQVMQQAQELRARGIDVIDLGPGEPDFPTPQHIKQAAIEAIQADFTRYTPSAGIAALRQAVADKYNTEWGTRFSAANVVITCGAKHAIYNLCMALFEDGDEVILPVPYWVTFPEAIRLSGAVPVDALTPEEDAFVLKAHKVAPQLNSKSRALVVNTPCNPTGAVIPTEEIAKLMELGRNQNLFLLFDETYEYFTYEGAEHTSAAAFVEPEEEYYAIVGSVSKTFAMTGWRIGYCVAGKELIRKIANFQSHQTGNACSVSQKAALAALQGGLGTVHSMREEYRLRRRFLLEALARIPGISCRESKGTFYLFPNVSQAMQAAGISSSQEFAEFLLDKAQVATVPGSAFGMEGFLRLSYATSMENLRKAVERIGAALEDIHEVHEETRS